VLAAGTYKEVIMANLSVHRSEQREPTAATVWDPLRAMTSMRSLDPFRMMRDLLTGDPFAGMVVPAGAMFAPDIEIKETKDAYALTLDLPGVPMSEIDISVMGNRLTVSGKREEEERKEDDRFFVYERSYGTFSRSFVLPDGADVDKIKAELQSGVLNIVVPKRAEMHARRVEIGGKEAGGKETGLPPGQKAEQGQKTEGAGKKAA
jgi:HSP20 family protein